jgi:hypothetical protein
MILSFNFLVLSVLCIRIGFSADLYPDLYFNADPDPGSQTNADTVPGQTLISQVEFFPERNILKVGNDHKTYLRRCKSHFES